MYRLSALVLFAILVLAACGGGSEDAAIDDSPGAEVEVPGEANGAALPVASGPSFSTDIAPIIGEVCARCHTGTGPGTAHVRMDTAGQVAADAFSIAGVVDLGFMPPWPASDLSIDFAGDWSLDTDQRALIAAWYDAGAPLDVDESAPIVPTDGLIELADPSVELMPQEPYDGSPERTDDYRCLVYDPEITETTWITGYEFVPDQTEVVHHAIGYLIPAEQAARATELAAEDAGGGWECFGGSKLGVNDIFLGWAPGQQPGDFPEGAGLRLEPGDFLVLQIHYHFEAPLDPPADASSLRLRFAPTGTDLDEIVVEQFLAPAEIPCAIGEAGPLCDRQTVLTQRILQYGLDGAPADFILRDCGATADDFAEMTTGVVSAECDTPVFTGGEVIGILGHQHELGSAFRMTLNPDTPNEQVLLDIPDWDFDWQFNYVPAESLTIERGDVVRIECTWDRARRDPDLEPAYVVWADGTNDEMCFATLTIREG